MAIKFVLLLALLLLTGFALRALRDQGTLRLMVPSALLFGVFFVFLPDSLTWIANELGIGRGSDLLLYALTIFFLWTTIFFYRELLLVRGKLARLVGELAIQNPQQQEKQL